ncbi:hypothetical protein GCM10017783_13590 [Deinococcus piscis]|uniref:DUF418 domain-containing protein n=1 Tax=Deinococcus piscis TaxID=394230 RepID=A0ABQ3K515_9DEIO|nr:DUF418 domain-containing protein [Deinococcus piscis]GHG02546.1 hypothetical protein GCM10017783_13590 [Deinococcus piscis]
MTIPLPPAPDTLPPAPVAAQDRALLPDALRGFALLGIALINVQDFSGFRVWEQQGLDRAVQVVTDVLFNGKAVALFAMLFGWGAAGLWERHGLGLYVRRHLLLLVIGLAHFALLWHGDIIGGYAVSAVIFILLLRRPTGALLKWAWGLYLLSALNYVAGYSLYKVTPGSRISFSPDFAPHQSYASILADRIAELPSQLGSGLFLASFTIPLFAFGAWAYRSGLLSRPAEHRPLLRRLLAWGFGLGLPLGLGLAYLNTLDTEQAGMLSEGLRVISGLPVAFGYVGLFGLLSLRPRVPAALTALARSGRLALTHYITQSLVLTLIFYPYTFGLYGQVGAAAAVGMALLLALAQIALSRWYLRRYGRGPLESLLRWAVYGRR